MPISKTVREKLLANRKFLAKVNPGTGERTVLQYSDELAKQPNMIPCDVHGTTIFGEMSVNKKGLNQMSGDELIDYAETKKIKVDKRWGDRRIRLTIKTTIAEREEDALGTSDEGEKEDKRE